MTSVRILIAEEAWSLPAIANSLEDYDLVSTTKLSDAQHLIEADGIGLFIIGVHFDESRATRLIGYIRRDKKHACVPILVVRRLDSKHEKTLRSTITSLIKVGTVNQYLELVGNTNIRQEIRHAVAELLGVAPPQVR